MTFLCFAVIFITVLLILLKLYVKLTTGWCKSQVCLKGKSVLITGANTGIGFETALDLAKRGARVIITCRSEDKAVETCDKIKKITHNDDITYKVVDFLSLKSVRKAAENINATENHIDILINNAGCGGLGDSLTEDGFQVTMQVNYFAPFLLTNLLVDLLKKSPSSRVINVSSIVGKYAKLDVEDPNKYYGDTLQYCVSKLCIILFTIEFASRFKDTNITTYSLHPGAVSTELYRKMPYVMRNLTNFFMGLIFKSPVEGAQTSIYLAVEDGIERFNGDHFQDCRRVERYKSARDPRLAKRLWEKSEELLKLK